MSPDPNHARPTFSGIWDTIRISEQEHAMPHEYPYGIACGYNCAEPHAQEDIRDAEHYGASIGSFRCAEGFSSLQINVLTLALWANLRIVSYAQLAQQLARFFSLQQSPESVRAVVNRLSARNILHHHLARRGTLRGVILKVEMHGLCIHIPRTSPDTLPAYRGDERIPVRGDSVHPPSILEKADRKNLSVSSEEIVARLEQLSENDIAFHWPELAKTGFGTDQIRQILRRNREVAIPSQRVFQSLNHAEWALAHGTLSDSSGNPVRSPNAWVFTILARQGYFPRPDGYLSPEEQVKRDEAEVERTRKRALCEELEEAQHSAKKRLEFTQESFERWSVNLSQEEKDAILTSDSPHPLPESARLHRYFLEHVWPTLDKS